MNSKRMIFRLMLVLLIAVTGISATQAKQSNDKMVELLDTGGDVAAVEGGPTCQLSRTDDANVTEVVIGTPLFTEITAQVEKMPAFTAMAQYAALAEATVMVPTVYTVEEATKAIVSYRALGEVDGFVTNFWVDYEAAELIMVQQYFVAQVAEDMVNFRIVVNDKEVISVDVNSELNVVTADGKEIYYTDFLEQLNVQGPLPEGWCHWAMAALCGAGGGLACYGLCGVAAIVNVLGGAGCAVACGLIGGLGCAGATCLICGGC